VNASGRLRFWEPYEVIEENECFYTVIDDRGEETQWNKEYFELDIWTQTSVYVPEVEPVKEELVEVPRMYIEPHRGRPFQGSLYQMVLTEEMIEVRNNRGKNRFCD
jgi:hypothetical protein